MIKTARVIEAHQRGQQLAQLVLKQTKEVRLWAKLLDSEDERIQLQALIHLSDRAYGKATQPNTISGSVEVLGFDLAHEIAEGRKRAANKEKENVI